MSAETVTLKIEEKAREAAKTIVAEAKAKAKENRETILSEAKERADKMLEASKERADIAEKGRARADALNMKLGVLEMKRSLLEIAKKDAKAKLLNMNEKEFVRIFTKYVSESELSGEFTLLPSANHRSLSAKAIKELAKATSLTLILSDEDANIDSGFILSSDSYDVEFSLDAIIDEVFEKEESNIADILFETGDGK